jgi:hypothetical protein
MSGPCLACNSFLLECEKHEKSNEEFERCEFCGKYKIDHPNDFEDSYKDFTYFSTDGTFRVNITVEAKDVVAPCRMIPSTRGIMCKDCAEIILKEARDAIQSIGGKMIFTSGTRYKMKPAHIRFQNEKFERFERNRIKRMKEMK